MFAVLVFNADPTKEPFLSFDQLYVSCTVYSIYMYSDPNKNSLKAKISVFAIRIPGEPSPHSTHRNNMDILLLAYLVLVNGCKCYNGKCCTVCIMYM